jgi:hypothetical protein
MLIAFPKKKRKKIYMLVDVVSFRRCHFCVPLVIYIRRLTVSERHRASQPLIIGVMTGCRMFNTYSSQKIVTNAVHDEFWVTFDEIRPSWII